MNKEEIKAELERHEKAVAELRKKLEEPELEPFEWSGENRCTIDVQTKVQLATTYQGVLWNFDTRKQAENFAKQLRLMSTILDLKKSLGDDWEFTEGELNYFVYYDIGYEKFSFWRVQVNVHAGVIYMREETAEKIRDWLDENWDWEKGVRK